MKLKNIRKHVGEKSPVPIEEINTVGHIDVPIVKQLFAATGSVKVGAI